MYLHRLKMTFISQHFQKSEPKHYRQTNTKTFVGDNDYFFKPTYFHTSNATHQWTVQLTYISWLTVIPSTLLACHQLTYNRKPCSSNAEVWYGTWVGNGITGTVNISKGPSFYRMCTVQLLYMRKFGHQGVYNVTYATSYVKKFALPQVQMGKNLPRFWNKKVRKSPCWYATIGFNKYKPNQTATKLQHKNLNNSYKIQTYTNNSKSNKNKAWFSPGNGWAYSIDPGTCTGYLWAQNTCQLCRGMVVTHEIELFRNNFEIISLFFHITVCFIVSVFHFTCDHIWNWNKIISATGGALKLLQNSFSDNEHVGKYSQAAINLWNNFEIISGKFPRTEKIISGGCRRRLK